MASRMDRYRDEEENLSRSSKNSELYENNDIGSVPERPIDINSVNAVEIDRKADLRSRENYHRAKELGFLSEDEEDKNEEEKKLDEFNEIYKPNERKVYDINTILEEARRENSDDSVKKDKRKNDDFILTKEEIEKYRKEREERARKDNEKMKDFINTITSKTLRGEIDEATGVDLLSDLLATSEYDRISNNTEILDKEAIDKVKEKAKEYDSVPEKPKELKSMDDSFYTKSMELNTKDFDMDDEFVEQKEMPSILKVLLVILLLVLVGVLIYFIVKSF